MRTRLYLAGRLAHEQWVAADHNAAGIAHAIGTMQATAAAQAEALGLPWMAELYDPEAPEGRNTVRFGTDGSMMDNPRPQGDIRAMMASIKSHPYHRWLHVKMDLERRRN